MKVDQIRESYLKFFEAKKHKRVSSDSLVPQNDPTLLFTGAGMNQFKEYFLGLKKDMTRATSSQKCMRTADLEEVGKTAFHHSFFEMLGNFSFGDYFKQEAIEWAWEYLTQVLKIPTNRLRVSVHKTDDEAYGIWRDQIKVREDWIYKMGDKDNFWPANAPKDGPNGPCGPCSEIYYDQDPDNADPGHIENGKRFAEIWNLVFTQFDRKDGGKLDPLANKNIDTGMGLERLACVLQGKQTNYEIDSFQPINDAIEKTLKIKTEGDLRRRVYAISDHVRGITFAITDGVIPSNEGRGYVIRKLIRRALWHAHQLTDGKLSEPFLYKIVPQISKVMKKAYPEIKEAEASIATSLKSEEERFLDALANGLEILKDRMKASKKKTLSGKVIFELYDTYGFPEELTRVIAEGEGFSLDHSGFEKLMEEQRKRAKAASQISGDIFASTELEKKLLELGKSTFLGYESLEAEAKVLLTDIQGEQGVIVLDQTPFYGESGGQVGDQGRIESKSFKARVVDTQKKDDRIIHAIVIEKGKVKVGDKVKAIVDKNRRESTMRNHTATHLLHAALRKILGSQVRQLGSLVNADKLRFDYSYGKPLSEEQVREIEDLVNHQILSNDDVSKVEKPIDQAKKEGAIAFFGEKYGSKVRVVSAGDYSKEFCGGTHCSSTGQIGSFVITSDSSIASGTRRIEALTGEGALAYMRQMRSQVNHLAHNLKTTPAELVTRVAKLQENLKKLEKEKKQGLSSKVDPKKIVEQGIKVGDFKIVTYQNKGVQIGELRNLSDAIRSTQGKVIYLLGTENEGKTNFLLGIGHELKGSDVKATDLWTLLCGKFALRGGGRPDLVQGGGPSLDEFDAMVELLKQSLKVAKA